MLLQLNPPIWLSTPKGDALAHVLIDYGPDHDLLWTAFVKSTGECWTFPNKDVRAVKNISLGMNTGSDIAVISSGRGETKTKEPL